MKNRGKRYFRDAADVWELYLAKAISMKERDETLRELAARRDAR